MTIQIIRRASLGLSPGAIRTLAPATEAALVLDGEAIYATAPNPGGDDRRVLYDPTTGQIIGADGAPIPAQVALSALVSGALISADGVALYDVTTTNSTTCTIGSASALFTAADIGKVCSLVPSTDTQLIAATSGAWGTITAVANANQCTAVISVAPGALTNAIFVYGTDNAAIIEDELSRLENIPTRGHFYLPAGIICTTGQHNIPSGVLLHGAGNNSTGGAAKTFKHYGTSLVLCKFYGAGSFLSLGSFGTADPRGCAVEYLNADCMNLTNRCIDGSTAGRTERMFAVTAVRGYGGATYFGGPTCRASFCHFFGANVSNVVEISGDGKLLDCIVVGQGAGFAKIKASNPSDILISRCHVWNSSGTTFTGYGIWASFNSGSTENGCITIVDNEIDTTFGDAYRISVSGAAAGRNVSIRGGHVFNNDQVPNNTGSVLSISVASGCTLKGLTFRDVQGMASFANGALGQWQYLINNSASAGTLAGVSTGGCVVTGCNALYNALTPDVDTVNIVMAGVSSTVTKSTRI